MIASAGAIVWMNLTGNRGSLDTFGRIAYFGPLVGLLALELASGRAFGRVGIYNRKELTADYWIAITIHTLFVCFFGFLIFAASH